MTKYLIFSAYILFSSCYANKNSIDNKWSKREANVNIYVMPRPQDTIPKVSITYTYDSSKWKIVPMSKEDSIKAKKLFKTDKL